MAFNVRNSRNEDGTYTLSYGRQSRKLTATMQKIDGQWECGVGPPQPTMKECKAQWAKWAEAAYEPVATTPTAPARSGPPSVKRAGPPAIKRPAPPRVTVPPRTPTPEPIPEPDNHIDMCDPFDPEFFDDEKRLTPLGSLDEIYNWMSRNSYLVLAPDSDTLLPPWCSVYSVLKRIRPESYSPIKRK